MPDKFIFVKEIKTQTKNNRSWRQAVSQDGETWQIFLDNPLEVNKCYVFSYEKDTDKGWNNLTKISPLVNIFQQKALKEVANRNDILRNFSVAFAYSKDLVVADKIPLDKIFIYADQIYDSFLECHHNITKDSCFTISYLQCCDHPVYRITRINHAGQITVWGIGGWSGGYGGVERLGCLRDPQPASSLYVYPSKSLSVK
jgi:hypothetical protein